MQCDAMRCEVCEREYLLITGSSNLQLHTLHKIADDINRVNFSNHAPPHENKQTKTGVRPAPVQPLKLVSETDIFIDAPGKHLSVSSSIRHRKCSGDFIRSKQCHHANLIIVRQRDGERESERAGTERRMSQEQG